MANFVRRKEGTIMRNSERQSFFAGLKHAFSKSKSADMDKKKEAKGFVCLQEASKNGKPVKCIRFVDYPVFSIDGEEYSVDLEDSKMMKDVYKYLDSLHEKTEAEFVITQKRTYAVPSLNKYLALTVQLACEGVDDGNRICCLVTHMGIENAVLIDKADKIEPEEVSQLH